MVRDTWTDAHQAATAATLDEHVSLVRRKLWIRRAAGFVLGAAAFVAVYQVLTRWIDSDARDLWEIRVLWPGYTLMGLGLALIVVGAARTSGRPRPFVGPDAFLSRTDRRWLRTQIAENRPVPGERHAVVAAAARRLVVEGRYLPTYLGWTVMYVGMIMGGPIPSTVVTFSAFIMWLWARAVRDALWGRRARRWLAEHATEELGTEELG